MGEQFFFGYGSLVNRSTHHFSPTYPARLTGWRRAWRSAEGRPFSFLTAIPDPHAALDGLIAAVLDDDWHALDQREAAYRRLDVTEDTVHDGRGIARVQVYAIDAGKHSAPRPECPVLLSYLDVVVQGYLQVFGEGGAALFFAVTQGWDAPILNDRAQPLYSRAKELTARERAFVDHALSDLDVSFIQRS